MDYLFFDKVNDYSYTIMKDMTNVMVIYGQRIGELQQQLNKNKDSITDLQFILKSPNGKSKKQKYISMNRDSLQVKERDVEEEIEKKKKQIQKEKDKQTKTQHYTHLIVNENNEKKKKEEQKKIEKEEQNLITGGMSNIIPPPITDSSNILNSINLNRINIEEPNSKTPKPQPKKNTTPISNTPLYTPNTGFSSLTPWTDTRSQHLHHPRPDQAPHQAQHQPPHLAHRQAHRYQLLQDQYPSPSLLNRNTR
jgi:hypothetical protein